MIVYHEPVPGYNIFGKPVICHREIRVTEDDAIRIQRQILWYRFGKEIPLSDEYLLADFLTLHWAQKKGQDAP